jgi:hemerythrin superfamily protein
MKSQARQRLSDDHCAVHEVLKQLLTALDNKDVEATYSKLDLLWARLAVHIRAEHLHLFPAVTKRPAPDSSDAQSVVETLRADHNFFMRKLAHAVDILRQLPAPLESPEDESKFNSVLDVVLDVEKRLAIHNETEENQVYRWASTILTEPEQIELAAQINAELEHRPSRFSVEAWANNP